MRCACVRACVCVCVYPSVRPSVRPSMRVFLHPQNFYCKTTHIFYIFYCFISFHILIFKSRGTKRTKTTRRRSTTTTQVRPLQLSQRARLRSENSSSPLRTMKSIVDSILSFHGNGELRSSGYCWRSLRSLAP